MIWRQDKQSGTALAFTCKQIAGCVKIFMNLVPVKSCRPSGKMRGNHMHWKTIQGSWHAYCCGQPWVWHMFFGVGLWWVVTTIHLSIEAQCGTACLPMGDCHTYWSQSTNHLGEETRSTHMYFNYFNCPFFAHESVHLSVSHIKVGQKSSKMKPLGVRTAFWGSTIFTCSPQLLDYM